MLSTPQLPPLPSTSLPAPPPLPTEVRRAMAAGRRRVVPTRWSQPKQIALARRVSVLDRFLGAHIERVKDLLVVQSVILSRQECARRALEASRVPPAGHVGWQVPRYLLDPLGGLARWPLPHAHLPSLGDTSDW